MIEAEQEVNLYSKQVNISDKCFMFLKMPFPFSTIKISCYEINHPFIFQQAKLILKIFPVKRETVKRNKTFREIPDG